MLTPCWPSAGPTGGAGFACPAGICSLMILMTFLAIATSWWSCARPAAASHGRERRDDSGGRRGGYPAIRWRARLARVGRAASRVVRGLVGWPLGRLVSVIRLSPQSRDTSGADKRGRRGAVIWPLGECQLAFSTQPIHLVTHPRHPPRAHSPSCTASAPANALQGPPGADQAGCVRESAPSGRAGGRGSSRLGYGVSRCTSARATHRQEFQTQRSGRDFVLDAPAAVARARLSHRRPVERASPPPRPPARASEARPRPGSYSWPEHRARTCRGRLRRRQARPMPSSRRSAGLHADRPGPPAERRGRCAAGTPTAAGLRVHPERAYALRG